VLLTFTGVGTLFVNFASANARFLTHHFFYEVWNGGMISEPQIFVSGDKGTIYNTTSISLQCYVDTSAGWKWIPDGKLIAVYCWLDEILWAQSSGDNLNKTFMFDLTELSDGQHSVKVEATAFYVYRQPTDGIISRYGTINKTGVSTVSFSVDTVPPDVHILVNQKRTYYASNVSLYFNVSEPVSYIGYSLNGQNVITVNSSAILSRCNFDNGYCLSLSDLPYGTHNVTVYVWDNAGHVGVSQTATFTVTTFPTTFVVAAATFSAVTVGVGHLSFFRKRKQKLSP